MKKLTVMGLGVKEFNQMTLESLQRVKEADGLLLLTPHFAEVTKKFSLHTEVIPVDLFRAYVNGQNDKVNYQRIFSIVMNHLELCDSLALFVPGHPRVGVSLIQLLNQACAEYSFELEVLPGVSSFDTMINDLQRDPLENGSVMIDGNRALLFNTEWCATLDAYIYHVCSIGTQNVHLDSAMKENKISLLVDHLSKIYGKGYEVELISSALVDDEASARKKIPLSELTDHLSTVHFGTTLFVRGQRPFSLNKNYLNQLLGT